MATRRTHLGLRRRGSGLKPPRTPPRAGRSEPRALTRGLGLGLALALLPGCLGLNQDETNRLDVHQTSSQEFYNANRLPQALQQAEKALELDADHEGMRLIKGFCLMRMGKAFANAEQLDKSIELFDDLRGGSSSANYRAWLGSGQAHFARALLHAEEALKIDRRLASDFLDDAGRERESAWLAAQREGQETHLSRSESALREALALDNQELNLWALIELALVLNTRTGHEDEAAQLTRSALEQLRQQDELTRRNLNRNASLSSSKSLQLEQRMEDNAARERELRDMLATLEYNRGALQAALEQFDILEEHQLMTAVQYYNRSAVYERLGMHTEAADDLEEFLSQRAVDVEYDDVAREIFARIRELRLLAKIGTEAVTEAVADEG